MGDLSCARRPETDRASASRRAAACGRAGRSTARRCTSAQAAGPWRRASAAERRCRPRRRSTCPAPMRWCSPAAPPPAIACSSARPVRGPPDARELRVVLEWFTELTKRTVILVTSIDDLRVAAYRHIADPDQLLDLGLFVAEGPTGRPTADRPAALGDRLDPAHAAGRGRLVDVLPKTDAPVYLASQEVMNEIAGFNIHRGCLALVRRPATPTLDRIAAGPLSRVLVLEGREQSRQRRRTVPQRRRVRHRAGRPRARTAAIRCIERRSARRWARRCRAVRARAAMARRDRRPAHRRIHGRRADTGARRRAARGRAPGRRSWRCWSDPRARA